MHVTPFFHLELRTLIILLASLVLAVLIGSYVMFQARFLIAGPQIVLAKELPPQHNTRTIMLTGTAYNITHLWLNGRPIFTDEAGYFNEALILENGYTKATLKARDRFGRETKVERPFVYTPTSLPKVVTN